jgi:hypothetical protein
MWTTVSAQDSQAVNLLEGKRVFDGAQGVELAGRSDHHDAFHPGVARVVEQFERRRKAEFVALAGENFFRRPRQYRHRLGERTRFGPGQQHPFNQSGFKGAGGDGRDDARPLGMLDRLFDAGAVNLFIRPEIHLVGPVPPRVTLDRDFQIVVLLNQKRAGFLHHRLEARRTDAAIAANARKLLRRSLTQ